MCVALLLAWLPRERVAFFFPTQSSASLAYLTTKHHHRPNIMHAAAVAAGVPNPAERPVKNAACSILTLFLPTHLLQRVLFLPCPRHRVQRRGSQPALRQVPLLPVSKPPPGPVLSRNISRCMNVEGGEGGFFPGLLATRPPAPSNTKKENL